MRATFYSERATFYIERATFYSERATFYSAQLCFSHINLTGDRRLIFIRRRQQIRKKILLKIIWIYRIIFISLYHNLKHNTMEKKFVCSVCNGSNIQVRAWIDPNKMEIIDYSSEEDQDTWCDDCEEHTGIIPIPDVIHAQDVLSVSEGLGIPINEEQLNRIMEIYPARAESDPGATWDLIVEDCIYEIVK